MLQNLKTCYKEELNLCKEKEFNSIVQYHCSIHYVLQQWYCFHPLFILMTLVSHRKCYYFWYGWKIRLPIAPTILLKMWLPKSSESDTKMLWATTTICFLDFLIRGIFNLMAWLLGLLFRNIALNTWLNYVKIDVIFYGQEDLQISTHAVFQQSKL